MMIDNCLSAAGNYGNYRSLCYIGLCLVHNARISNIYFDCLVLNTATEMFFLEKKKFSFVYRSPSKGQLISKCLFGIFNSPKNRTKKIDFTTMVPQVELFSFVIWEN